MSHEFDHTVHHRDKKSGKIIRETHYSLLCYKGMRFYKRADGAWFDGAGQAIEDPIKSGLVVQEKPQGGGQAAHAFTRSQVAK